MNLKQADLFHKLCEDPKVVYDRAKRAASKGYYEYGVSIPYGWLTPEGRAFLAAQTDGPSS